jgi:hypothetical protein
MWICMIIHIIHFVCGLDYNQKGSKQYLELFSFFLLLDADGPSRLALITTLAGKSSAGQSSVSSATQP